ncbi:hypothetical protein CJU89_6147 [Yarrowia sp. B02]|nr:hypothetical protein CJU89_6147 [Yarrowia sp. B02]
MHLLGFRFFSAIDSHVSSQHVLFLDSSGPVWLSRRLFRYLKVSRLSCDAYRLSHASASVNCSGSFTQLCAAKLVVKNIVDDNQHWCALCAILGHSKDKMADQYTHSLHDCALNRLLEIRDCDTIYTRGNLMGHVYAGGSVRANDAGEAESGVGVWFGPRDPDNAALPCRAETTVDAELMVVILALQKLQHREPRNYEVLCDSMLTSNLAKGFGLHLEAPPTQSLAWIAGKLVASLRKKVRLTHVQDHLHSKGNSCAHNMANIGRAKSERLDEQQFFWLYDEPVSSLRARVQN